MKTLLVGLIFLGLFSKGWCSAPNPDDAHLLVEQTITTLLSSIAEEKAKTKSSPDQLMQRVDLILSDVVDYKRIAKRVMAKYYRKASKEQKKAFFVVFKSSLLTTYVKGLLGFEDYKVRVLPLRSGKQSERNTLVNFEVITASGQVFPITQSMFYHRKNERWMAQNVIINGVNIGQLFRDQFARLVSENKGDITLAIDAWGKSIEEGAKGIKGGKRESAG